MKTSLKRFFAGVAAAAMAVGGLALGATSAQAADPVASAQKGSLTVNARNGTDGKGAAGHTLKAYLVAAYNSDYKPKADGSLDFDTFKYVVTKDNDTTSNDESAVEAALNAALKDKMPSASGSASAAEEGLKQLTLSTDYGKDAGTFGYTANSATASAAERTFADTLAAKIKDGTWKPSNAAQELKESTDGKSFTADLNPEGLYLVVDTYKQENDSNSTQSVPMLVGTKFASLSDDANKKLGVGEIDMKNTTIPVHKEVVDEHGAANNKPSYNIGDTVYFHLSTKIPNYSGYAADPTLSPTSGKTRLLSLEDEFEKDKFTDMKVVSVKDSTANIGLASGTDYDEELNKDTDTLTVDLKKLVNGYKDAKTGLKAKTGWKTGDVIDVVVSGVLSANATTTDTVNENVTTGADSKGNYNKVTLNYSNNPKDNSQQNKVPGDTVNVYSFNLNVHKVDQNNLSLGGAEFQIVDKEDKTETPLQFTLQSDGTYTHAKDKAADTKDTLKSAASDGTTVKKGDIKVKGLKAGTYVVKETKAPTGFFQGALPSYDVTITEHYTNDKTNTTRPSESGDDWLDTLTYSNTPDNYGLVTKDATSPSTWTVKNVKSITQLPKTGAAGIAFFSIIGVAVVALAALFAVRARKASRLA